ncbi:MAG: F0F1 ATP synthase subunit epsilon [Alphaproteobacteria bacterium]
MHVIVLTVDQKLYEGDTDMIVLPGSAGELGILDNHEPLMTSLRAGAIKLYQKQAVTHEFPIQSGFARVAAESCKVYVF